MIILAEGVDSNAERTGMGNAHTGGIGLREGGSLAREGRVDIICFTHYALEVTGYTKYSYTKPKGKA